MKTLFTVLGLFILSLAYADEGQELYNKSCLACHTIGKGRLVGPDLLNVSEKRSQDWLIDFIQSSRRLIESGDAEAIAIFEEYNKMPMPDNAFTDAQAIAVLDYIKRESSGNESSGQAASPADILSEATDENTASGALLFTGEKRLANGGAACNSCHNVQDADVFSHGTLAMDLTESWANMGSAGASAIIKSPPFPLMTEAYRNHPVTEQEVLDLTAYLKSVSENRPEQAMQSYDLWMAAYGFVGFLVIMGLILAFYSNRKPVPVAG